MKILVKFDSDWADEFQANGFRVFTPEKWEQFKSEIPDSPGEVGFGTNEFFEFVDKADYFYSIEEIEISDVEAETLIRLFGPDIELYGYGIFPDPREQEF